MISEIITEDVLIHCGNIYNTAYITRITQSVATAIIYNFGNL